MHCHDYSMTIIVTFRHCYLDLLRDVSGVDYLEEYFLL